MIGRILCSALIALAACGGGSSSNQQHMDSGTTMKMDGGTTQADAATDDFGCGGNTACTTDKVCCAMPGTTTTFGCVDKTACPAADKIVCDGPDECGGTTPVCCGVYVANGGSPPKCTISALGTSCTTAAACPTHLAINNCHDTTKVQICHISAECSDPVNNKCCTFQSGGASLSFCIDSTTAQLGGGTCN